MGEIIETYRLENGLILLIFDHSRRMVGDRWLVSLEARIDIDVEDEVKREILGEKISFSYKKERNFIDKREKDKVFSELKRNFLNSTWPYISKKDFAKRFIESKIREKEGGIMAWKRF